MFQLFLFDAIVVLCLLIWITRGRREVNRIPGPRVYPIIGNLPDLIQIRRGAIDYLQERRDRFGPIFRLSFLGKDFIFLSEPDYIRTILSSSENLQRPPFASIIERWTGKGLSSSTGVLWHSQKRLLEPSFCNLKIKLFIPSIVERCEIMCNDLHNFDGQEIDLLAVMRDLSVRLAYDNILNVRFDESEQKEVANAGGELMYLLLRRMLRPWLWTDFLYSVTANASREEILVKKLHGITLEAISLKKKQINEKLESRNQISVLDYLIECQKEDGSLSDEDIRTHLDTLISSVMNAFPIAISLILYLVASHDSVQDHIRRELRSVLPEPLSSKRAPTMYELSRLKYLESVINESLRFIKPPLGVGRQISKEILVGGYSIPAGCSVVVDTNALHHDKRYYSTPDEFNPGHFNPEEVEQRPLYAFLPFGRSLRACIAEKYSRMLLKLVISSIIQHFQIKSTQPIETMMQAQLRALIQPRDSSNGPKWWQAQAVPSSYSTRGSGQP